MKEPIIRIDTAKLIPNPKSEDAFNSCEWFYVDTTTEKGYFMAGRSRLDIDYPAPTQSLLQKFIREKWGIHIEIEYHSDTRWTWQLRSMEKMPNPSPTSLCKYEFLNFEDALEDALREALKVVERLPKY